MIERIDVALGHRGYPVWIGGGLLDDPQRWREWLSGRRVLLVSDAHVAPLYGARLLAALAGAAAVAQVTLPAGESSKTLGSCSIVFDALSDLRAGRDALIIGLGGGVVGDLAGFAAACWMRGIDFMQAPTTLLAMVDSSVGGKTGVNVPQGKNLVGAFHQPIAVMADVSTLGSLPDREFVSGLAEVVKYAALGDAGFFAWLDTHAKALRAREPAVLRQAIATCVRHKAAIVERDEHEQGERALLNFGHTFGHAIEAATGYDTFLHGEAVAIGMMQAARLSSRLGLADAADADRLQRVLSAMGLPVSIGSSIEPARLLGHMRLDKKATATGLRFVLWRGVGATEVVGGVDDGDVLAALDESSAR